MVKKSIPSLITCLNLCCGVLAILSEDLRIGVLLIIIGGVLDVFDGLVARMLNVTTRIGAQLDSLADVVSFGVAPAILFYRAYEGDGSIMSLLAPLFIVTAGALRLARFNVKETSTDYFEGLAIPSTGFFFCGLVIAMHYGDQIGNLLSSSFLITTTLAATMAFLNISTIKMFSFKQFSKSTIVKIYFLILILVLVIFLYYLPYSSISLIIITYVLLAILDHYIFDSEKEIKAIK